MKLIFSKTPNSEIHVKLQKGTVIEDFTYIEMVRQLLVDNNFEDSKFVDLSDDEIMKIKSMLAKIVDAMTPDHP